MEFYAEWLLVPSNLAYQRLHTGLLDPVTVGDKFKWFAHTLAPVSFVVWDNLSSLNSALKCLQEAEVAPATDESGSDTDGGSSSSSFSSLSEVGPAEPPRARAATDPAPRMRPHQSQQQEVNNFVLQTLSFVLLLISAVE